jgi:adenylate kinase
MAQLIEEMLQKADRCVVLDGYPRTLVQAATLEGLAHRLGWQVAMVLLLDVGEQELIERLSARRVCPNCQAIYNLLSAPPRQDERCDVCGAALVQRDDDRPEVVLHRLAVYREQTQPVADYYARRGMLVTVNASGTPEEVYARLRQVTAR